MLFLAPIANLTEQKLKFSNTASSIIANYDWTNRECCGPYRFTMNIESIENLNDKFEATSGTYPCEDVSFVAAEIKTDDSIILNPYRNYSVTLQVFTVDGNKTLNGSGNVLNEVHTITKSAIPASFDVGNFTSVPTSNTTMKVSWSFAFKNCTGNNTVFTLTLIGESAQDTKTNITEPVDCYSFYHSAKQYELTVGGLKPSENYSVELSMENEAGPYNNGDAFRQIFQQIPGNG